MDVAMIKEDDLHEVVDYAFNGRFPEYSKKLPTAIRDRFISGAVISRTEYMKAMRAMIGSEKTMDKL